jgi:hypothetical protein
MVVSSSAHLSLFVSVWLLACCNGGEGARRKRRGWFGEK